MTADSDSASILLRFANSSTAAIHYFTNGSKKYDKERIEMYSTGRTLVLQNWRKLQGFGFKSFSSASSSQDKGHTAQVAEWMKRICDGRKAPVPFDEIFNVSRATLCIMDSLRERRWVDV